MTENNVLTPIVPPEPPQLPSPLEELKDIVKAEVEEKTKTFLDIPTPAAFATLKTDVKHLWRYFLFLGGAIATLYFYLDAKISILETKISIETKVSNSNYNDLENRINDTIERVNNRVDNMLITNGASVKNDAKSD